MDRRTPYHGQTVTAGEADEWLDDAENMERNLAIDSALGAASTADSPDCTVYGGILSGLVVVRHGTDDYVDVSAGIARDNRGYRINLPSAATVKITKTGATVAGVLADAVGDGANITGSCGAGDYIIASLFVVPEVTLADPRVDALGAPIYYDMIESFKFDIQIGTSYAGPAPAVPPTRAPLADHKVLIADIILTNAAGAMQLPAYGVRNTDSDWVGLTGYTGLTGRRSDWLTIVFPPADLGPSAAVSDPDIIRAKSSREALTQLAAHVGGNAVYAGVGLGRRAIHSVHARLMGDPVIPSGIFEEFMYTSAQAAAGAFRGITVTTGLGASAGMATIDDAVGVHGWDVSVGCGLSNLALGNGPFGAGGGEVFALTEAPYAVCACRFRLANGTDDINFTIGFFDATGNIFAYAHYDPATAVLEAICAGETGVPGTPVPIGTLSIDTWYTVRICSRVGDASKAYFQLDNGTITEAECAPADFIGPGRRFNFVIICGTGGAGAARWLGIDRIYVSALRPSADMF